MVEDLTFINSSRIVASVCRQADQMGYQTLIANLDIYQKGQRLIPDKAFLRPLIETICRQITIPVMGMIYVAQYEWDVTGLMPKMPYPIVYTYCTGHDPSVYIYYDDRQGAILATQELITQGCRSIAMISGPINSIPMSERMSGYQKALVGSGMTFDPRQVYIGDWSLESGRRMAEELLQSRRHVDGIFAQNDHMASGVLQVLHERNIRVPEDIAVMGFDNHDLCSSCYPQLSSIGAPLDEIGMTAMQQLDKLLRGSPREKRKIILPCRLFRRRSTQKTITD